jgi:hypothetical protein
MRKALQKMPHHQLDKFTMTVDEFDEALVEEFEMKVKGKMYDIACIEVKGKTVTVFGKHDEKEDNLLALLDYVVSSPIKNKNEIPSSVWQFISMTFVIPFDKLKIASLHLTGYNPVPYFFTNNSFIASIKVPPPRWTLFPNVNRSPVL